MINWERRKQSEKWTREKSIEFYRTNSDLTFVEWCYQQGKAEEQEKIIAILDSADDSENAMYLLGKYLISEQLTEQNNKKC